MGINLNHVFGKGNKIFQKIFDSIAEGVVVANKNGEFLYFNHVAEEILGIGMQDVRQEEWSNVYGCFYLDQITPFPSSKLPLSQIIETGKMSKESVFIKNSARPNGVFIDISGSPILDADNSILGGIIVFKDITEQKNFEKHLLKLSNAINQTADAIVITDKNGIIEYVNPAFEHMSGFNKVDVIGKTPQSIENFVYDRTFYKDLWSTLLNGKAYKTEMLNVKKTGEQFWTQYTVTPIKDEFDNLTHFVTVIKDISEIKANKERVNRLNMARDIQRHLLASDICIPGYDIKGKNYPADETGGDYFDILCTPDGNLWLTIGDVSGHGIGPALIMAGARAYLRSFTQISSSPAEVLRKLNNALFADLNTEQFVTQILIRLNNETNIIEYSGAGHVPSYLINKEGDVKHVLSSTGIPLGIVKDETFTNKSITDVSEGDILVMLTDGILEAHDGRECEFGDERILNLIKNHRNKKADDIIEHIYENVCDFTYDSPPEDDITALICKLNKFQSL